MEDLLKSWKTSLVGLLIIGFTIYHYQKTGSMDWAATVTLLAGVGFLQAKDASDSHTKR